MEYTILQNDNDFKWHKKALDVKSMYEHRHNGNPDQYPCKVASTHWDDPNGPYTYDHAFFYKIKTKCECCGHETAAWPEQASP